MGRCSIMKCEASQKNFTKPSPPHKLHCQQPQPQPHQLRNSQNTKHTQHTRTLKNHSQWRQLRHLSSTPPPPRNYHQHPSSGSSHVSHCSRNSPTWIHPSNAFSKQSFPRFPNRLKIHSSEFTTPPLSRTGTASIGQFDNSAPPTQNFPTDP